MKKRRLTWYGHLISLSEDTPARSTQSSTKIVKETKRTIKANRVETNNERLGKSIEVVASGGAF